MFEIVHDTNYIKRCIKKKEEAKKATAKMRAALPVYTLDEIRKFRLPYHEALLIELNEKGYYSTAEYINQLLKYNDDLRDASGQHNFVWNRPKLMVCKEELNILKSGLVKSEIYHNQERYKKECEEFLRLAINFAFGSNNWWWLGEQLLLQSISIATEYRSLGNYFVAFSKFCYGKFLTVNFKEYELAINELDRARELSENTEWTTKNVFPDSKESLYVQINYYLYICYIELAKGYMNGNTVAAMKMAILARSSAADACYREGMSEALMFTGLCQLELNDVDSATITLGKAVNIQLKLGSMAGICDARLHLSKAYLKNGNVQEALGLLMVVKENAHELEMPYYLAQVYYNLGRYYLSVADLKKATKLLKESQKLFLETNHLKEHEELEILSGVSYGLQLLPIYLSVMNNTGPQDSKGQNLTKLIDWKDSREPFKDPEDNISEYQSMETILPEEISLLCKLKINKDIHK